ncbi:MAG TPA: acyl-CoA dehydrogenase [Polyangiaceae bacterium]|jgi:butyryl-CoA dehydrogenase|nr:acyl-CoA dehydrogenase [Polyangiaceae bacterium]
MANPLLDDRTVDFLLYEVFDVERLTELAAFREHSRETFDMYLGACRKLARERLFPSYRAIDEAPPRLEGGRVKVHPVLRELYPKMAELGLLNATRPEAVGGQQLPAAVASLSNAYLMAANLSAYAYAGLTSSAARLIESFGSDALREEYMQRMYAGEWTGTMALTEPQAGSSLSDVKTRATPTEGAHYSMRGSKIFISGGDQDMTENIVHMVLARIDGAPPGVKGISLFVVPALRSEGGKLVPNDTAAAGVIHKIGWKGIPSIALNLGDNGDCHGYLVGEAHRGLTYMFQMMNEARLMVGLNGVSTASVAYQEALEYAKTRPQGRPARNKNPEAPQVPLVEHADVRRMLLRQKAIVEGGLALLCYASRAQDLAEHAASPDERREHQLLLDLLTPVAKSFPAERGFESNTLSVQVHGGYGYSSEYLPEAWLRDQKLNSLHEGTTGIQSIDLLGRKVSLHGGVALELLGREIGRAVAQARAAKVDAAWCDAVERAFRTTRDVTAFLSSLGNPEATLLHSVDYLDLFSTLIVGWMWLLQSIAAKNALARSPIDTTLYEGKLCAAQYFILTELPRVELLAALCRSGEDSYGRIHPEWF